MLGYLGHSNMFLHVLHRELVATLYFFSDTDSFMLASLPCVRGKNLWNESEWRRGPDSEMTCLENRL